MKVFVSSVISGFEEQRDAVENAVESLGHTVIRAEGFAASNASPRIACLSGVREANVIVLLLGARYGVPLPPDDISPTHQEYREAKGNKPILAFIEEGASFEPKQAAFVKEVEDWEQGVFRGSFSSSEILRRQVTKALHQFEVSAAVAPVNGQQLLEAAIGSLQFDTDNYYSSRGPRLKVGIAGGPLQRVLRPAEIENKDLAKDILQIALFGGQSVFSTSSGNLFSNQSDKLVVRQESGNFITLDESGHICIALSIEREGSSFPVLIQESISEKIARACRLAASILDKVDQAQKVSRVAVAVLLEGADYVSWQKRSDYDPNATSITLGHSIAGERSRAVHLNPPDIARSALSFDAKRIAEDLTTLLRRRSA